jgi:hypothetical protein
MKISKLLLVCTLAIALSSAGAALANDCTAGLFSGIDPAFGTRIVGQTIEYEIFLEVPDNEIYCDLTQIAVYWYPPPLGSHPGSACEEIAEEYLLVDGLTLTPGDSILLTSATYPELAYTVQEGDAGGVLHAEVAFDYLIEDVAPQCDEEGSHITVRPLPCIEIDKTVDCDEATLGTEVTYEFCVSNCGENDLEITALEDDVLGDLSGEFYTANGDSYILASDAEVCIYVDYTIQSDDPDPLDNFVYVDAVDDFGQAAYDDDEDSVDILVPCLI